MGVFIVIEIYSQQYILISLNFHYFALKLVVISKRFSFSAATALMLLPLVLSSFTTKVCALATTKCFLQNIKCCLVVNNNVAFSTIDRRSKAIQKCTHSSNSLYDVSCIMVIHGPEKVVKLGKFVEKRCLPLDIPFIFLKS